MMESLQASKLPEVTGDSNEWQCSISWKAGNGTENRVRYSTDIISYRQHRCGMTNQHFGYCRCRYCGEYRT